MISPFSSFLPFTSLGMLFLFSFSVPTQSVECSGFSCQNFFCHCNAPIITPEWTAEWSALTENMQGKYHMLIATPNERLNYSLPIYRRNQHMISVLTSSQHKKWSPCSARVDDENISDYRTQCSIYEWIIFPQQKKPKILRLQRYIVQTVALFLSVSVKQRELWECTFLTLEGGLFLNRKINSWIRNVTF